MTLYDYFLSIDEPYAAGLFEDTGKGYFYRHCNAYALWYSRLTPVPYEAGERLYPHGNRSKLLNRETRAVKPQYANTYEVNWDLLGEKGCLPDSEPYRALKEFCEISHGWGWMHGAANYPRVVREGLDSYRRRVAARPENTAEEAEFKAGLLRLLDAMKGCVNRCREYLLAVNAPQALTDALAQVPFQPARSYYEGLVSWNAVFYFDGCDNLGCLDAGLGYLYNGEDYTDVIGELFSNLDAMDQWSCSIGPEVNEVTRQALRAIDGKRRPMLEFKVNGPVPEEIWQTAYESLKKGNCNPSFYNDTGIQAMLHERFPQISARDLTLFCGCGCTETNLMGVTRAGGTDFDINLLKIFEDYLYEEAEHHPDFESFFEGMCRKAETVTENRLDLLEARYEYLSHYLPNPMRTLLYDDCIDKGRDFNAGGARYTWTMNSESGLINVIDSLAAVKQLVYDEKKYSPAAFCALLKAEDEGLFADFKKCPCYGVDDKAVDAMGAAFARRVFAVYRNKKPRLPYLDGFTLTEHQFSRYEWCGTMVGPTPDGRRNHQPTCDSVAAIRGKAVKGPTAMLCSAAKLPQNMVDGITVINVTLSKDTFNSPAVLQALVAGYFALDGIQLQFTITSAEELRDALAHPEKYPDLIVRVGGYSEYFNRLTDALKVAVVERNIHELQ